MGKQGEFKDDVSIPISAEIFDLDDHDIFHDTLQSSEVTCSPNCCSYEDKKSSYSRTSSSSSTTTITPDFLYRLNPTSTTTTVDLGDHVVLSTLVDPTVTDPLAGVPPLELGPILEEDCMTTSFPAFLRTTATMSNSSCATPILSSFQSAGLCTCTDSSGLFGGTLLMASQLQAKQVDFQEDDAAVIFCPHQFGPNNNSGDLQTFSNKNTELVNEGTNSTPNNLTEVSSIDESTYKTVGKLSAEQRKEKIHRYLKKRNERNFSKKIKYACRKTLADSRPRVRGRFAKNDEFGEGHRHAHEWSR